VGTSAALARTWLQPAPFALRAGSAETADLALEAENTTSFGGLPSDIFGQLWENTNLDGQGPNNTDPLEGLLDSDGDGTANFVDPDNDGDGVQDSAEIAQGAHPNLPTPRASAIQPNRGITFSSTPVTVVGQGFQPGLTADLGGIVLSPQSVTPTSFLAQIPPAPVGTRALHLTNPNGETASLQNAFVHEQLLSGGGEVDVHGPQQLLLSGGGGLYNVSTDSDYVTDVTFNVSNVFGKSLAWNDAGRVTGLLCFGGVSSCLVQFRTDTDGDFDLSDETGVPVEPAAVAGWAVPSLTFDPSGRPAGAYLKASGARIPTVFHDRDGDGLFTGPNEKVELQSFVGSATPRLAVAVDPAGRVAVVHQGVAGPSSVVTAYDRSGDGDFDDVVGGTPETYTYTYATQPTCIGMTFTGSARLAVVVGALGSPLTLGRDLDGDGNWSEAGEVTNLASSAHCGMASGPGIPLVVTRVHESGGVQALRDLNEDGDFSDANESQVFATVNMPTRHSVRVGTTGITFVGTADGELVISPP